MGNIYRVRAWVRIAVPSVLALMLAGCGGSGSSGSSSLGASSGGASSASPLVGVWTGSDTQATGSIPVEALIDASGDFEIIRIGTPAAPADNAQFVGTATASGTSLPSTSFQGFEPTGGTPFFDGSYHGSGTFSGTVDAGSSISANYTFTTDMNTTTTGTLSLNYSAQTGQGSSLSAIATTFTDPSDSNNFIAIAPSTGSVRGEADVGGTSPGNCSYTGTVGILKSNYDIYSVQLKFGTCTGVYGGLSNATLKGFATLDPTASPASLLLGVAGQSPGTTNNAYVFSGVE